MSRRSSEEAYGREILRVVGSHLEIPSAIRSDRSNTRFTIGKSQGEIPIERGSSDLKIDKKSALKRRTGLSYQIRAQGLNTVGSRRTYTVFKLQEGLAAVMGITVI